MIPNVDSTFVPFGHYDTCEKILNSNLFFPALLTGPSGVGKTKMLEQLCAKHKKNYYRINIIYETDEDDLMGGIRLNDGSTMFERGPVIAAMEEGAVLVLDEVDLASPLLIMCLQSVLEGSGYYIKKSKEWVVPKEGFQIFATANTKGIGDNTGQFIGTQLLNEAFLERFSVTLECTYPKKSEEKKILTLMFKHCNMEPDELIISSLLDFAGEIRSSFERGLIENTISTRRLIHYIKSYYIWRDPLVSFEYTFSRFDKGVYDAFFSIFAICLEKNKKRIEEKNNKKNDPKKPTYRYNPPNWNSY